MAHSAAIYPKPAPLIRNRKSPVLRDPVTGDRHFHPYGYHIENQRFTAFLGTVAQKEGSGFTMAKYRDSSLTIPAPSTPSKSILGKAILPTSSSIAPASRRYFSSAWV